MDQARTEPAGHGPLTNVRVVEFAAIGPGPFAAMLLSDMGAEVVTIARLGHGRRDEGEFVQRGRTVVELDLKQPDQRAAASNLIQHTDVLIEGFRPGVMERLSLGPQEMFARNPKLIYGRMTGWGQYGPLSHAAGHDINYIAITGALDCFRSRTGEPVSPLNLVGDFAGGALYLAMGVLAALHAVQMTGQGQVVDAAMCDGVSSLLTYFQSRRALGLWDDQRPSHVLEGASHFYHSYECSDGKYITVGAIEPEFYRTLRELTGLDDPAFDAQRDATQWPELTQKLAQLFKSRTRDEWAALLENTDACVQPVVSLSEASRHPHLAARNVYTKVGQFLQPSPAPRFSRTPSAIQGPANVNPISASEVLRAWRSQRGHTAFGGED